MALNRRSLKKLRDGLPSRYGVILKERLEKRHHITFTLSYIYACLDPDNLRYHKTVINEAVELLRETKEEDKAAEDLITALSEA